jgi:uncharacterized protein
VNLGERLRAVVRSGSSRIPQQPAQSGSSRIPQEVDESGSSRIPQQPAESGSRPALQRQDVGSGFSRSSRDEHAHLEETLGGEFRDYSGHRSFVVTRRHEAASLHGRTHVGDFAERLHRAYASAPFVSVPAARPPFVFFDLETTGLSGGAGTHAFVVGCGWFDADDGFITEQHLLVDYASERAMLKAVAGELERAGAIVSFNGKSFDAPLLETRCLFHRMASPCGPLPHVDVLHPARQFWGRVGGGDVERFAPQESGCSLMAFERRVLGATRGGDVPGFEIPGRYFQFVRSGDPRPLAPVFEHNRLDLLSLAGLTARLLYTIDRGPAETRDACEALALGRVYTRAGLTSRADEAYRRALKLSDGSAPGRTSTSMGLLRIEALRSLALGARQARHYDAAAAYWREVLDVPGCPRSIARQAGEALAIHHEHRARDLPAAKAFALRTLELDSEAARGDAVRHRLARIERKMISERPLFPSLPLQPPPSCGSPRSGPRTSS